MNPALQKRQATLPFDPDQDRAGHSPGVSVREQILPQDREYKQLEQSGLLGAAPIEAWTVNGTNVQNAYSTHGVFRYFGKYPPPIGERLIREHTAPGDLVIDPMCGSGTTGVESILCGRRSRLFDVNALSRLVAKTKTTHLSEGESRPVLEDIIKKATPLNNEENPFELRGLRKPEHWFLDKTMNSLRGLRARIVQVPEGPSKDLMWTAFAGTIRRVSRATTQQGRLFLDVETALEDALPTFQRVAERAIEAVAQFPRVGDCTVEDIDAREITPSHVAENARLIILHPPYFNSYRYSGINSLELAWLGHDVKALRKREVREFFKVGKPEKVEHYVEDMVQVMNAVARLLLPGGHLGLMIGDTYLRGTYIPTTRLILDRVLKTSGLDLVKIAVRVPRYTEASWVASQRRTSGQLGAALCDYVLTLRRV